MTHFRITFCLFCAIAGCVSVAFADAGSVQAMESGYDRLIELRKTQADEAAAWADEKEVMLDRVRLLETEAASLRERIAAAGDMRTGVRAELDELNARKDVAVASSNAVAALLPAYELRVKWLVKRLPPPLVQEIAPSLSKLPTDGQAATWSTTERLKNLLGILSSIDKFNQQVCVVKEIRDAGDGVEGELRTLYLGLGIAYYVDKSGRCAGMGRPDADAWVWTRDDALAADVMEMLSMYDSAAEARLVHMKMEVR